MCGVFLCPKQKASLLKDAFSISDSEFFPGKSNLSFFPVIPVLFSMKHFSKKRQSLNQLSFLLLFSAGFFFQYFFPIFLPGIGMFPHPPTAVCLSFLYAGNRNISLFLRNRRKNRLPCPYKNFPPESGPANSPQFTGNFSIVSRETFFFFPCLHIHQIYRNTRTSFSGTGYHFPSQGIFFCSLFPDQTVFPTPKKSGLFPAAVHCGPFFLHSTLQKQESEAVPGRTFLTKRLSGDSNR